MRLTVGSQLAEEHQRRKVVEGNQWIAFNSWCADSERFWCVDSKPLWRRWNFSWSGLANVQNQTPPSNIPVSNKASVAVTPYRCLSLVSIFSGTSLPPLRTTLGLPRLSRSVTLRSIVRQLTAVPFLLKPHFLNCRSYWPLL
jgi:hypothetical protein